MKHRRISCSMLLLLSFTLASLTHAQDVTYNVYEEQQAKSFVGNVARDINLEAQLPTQVFNSLQYSVLASSGAHGDLFQVDSDTADLFTARRLDRETICRFSVVCELNIKVAAVAGQYFKNIRVRVLLQDVNDNAPRFNRSSMTLEIPESVTVGASYSLEGALDDDTGVNNSVQSYALNPNDGPFSIFFTQKLDRTSDVTLVVNEPLDREKKDSYALKLIASDAGVPLRTAMMSIAVKVIDVNDNAPRFSQNSYQRSIGENVRPGDVILRVTATDADEGLNAQVRYRLSARQDGSMAALFSVDESTGDILIQQLPTSGQYSIIVEAVDGGSPPKETQVEVDVNIIDTTNNPPQIVVTLLSQAVSEGSSLRSPVAHVSVEDPDSGNNGQVNCYSQSAYFDLRRLEDSDMMVEVARPLDREDSPAYRVTLFCQDSGTPRLNATATFMVEIEDVNDNPPVFPNANISVSFPEGDRVGQVVMTVIATDADIGVNAEISYSIVEGGDGFFYIPKGTGSVAAARPLDRESRDEYVMKVLAVDGGEPQQSATAMVTISVEDINDEVPVFSEKEYIFRMKENRPAGTVVGIFTATDPDLGEGGKVTFSLSPTQPHASSMFKLHENGTLLTKGMLDREANAEIIFHVIASDQGTPRLNSIQEVTVILQDENDNNPVFLFPGPSNHSITLYVPIKEDAHLFKLNVIDADEGQNSVLAYSLASSNMSSMFSVDSLSGDVWAKRSFGEGYLGTYDLTFQAADGGEPPLYTSSVLSLTIKLNPDSQPIAAETNNAVIVISIVVATLVIAVIVVLVVCWVRRRDKGKELQYVNKLDNNNVKAKGSTEQDPYLERQNTPSMFFTSSSNNQANGSLSPKLSIGFPAEAGQYRRSPNSSPHWDPDPLDVLEKDEVEGGGDMQTLNRVTSLRLQQAFEHISSIKSQLVTATDTGKPYEWREIHVPGRPEDFNSLSSRGTGNGDSGLGTDEDGVFINNPATILPNHNHNHNHFPLHNHHHPQPHHHHPHHHSLSHSHNHSANSRRKLGIRSYSQPGSDNSHDSSQQSCSSLPNLYLKPGSDILVFRPTSATSYESSPSDNVDDNCTTTSGSYSITFEEPGGLKEASYVHDVYV